ncbi:hypothetical protein Emed_007033 [Eimeria media]
MGCAQIRISGTQQQPSQQHDQHYATLVAAMEEALQSVKAESNTSNAQCGNARSAFFTECLMQPPPFHGQRPREWLAKLKRYHSLVGLPESMRVEDAFNYLEGAAFTHFSSAHKAGKAPVTWKEFEIFILDRFSRQNVGETIRRLRNLRWDGSLKRLAARFDAVLAEGDSPPKEELVRIFLSRLPFRLVRLVCREHFDTWIAAKEALREALAPEERARQLWLIDAPPELVLEEEATIRFRQQPRSRRQEYQPYHMLSSEKPANKREFKAQIKPQQKSRSKERRTTDSRQTNETQEALESQQLHFLAQSQKTGESKRGKSTLSEKGGGDDRTAAVAQPSAGHQDSSMHTLVSRCMEALESLTAMNN